jgi:cytoskeletal protein CcmA (bactofilin family)
MAFSNNHTLISRSTKIIGDVYFSGELQIEGQIKGNIFVGDGKDAKDAKLVVADTGLVEGEIHAPLVVVNGRVSGNIFATKHLELAAKAMVAGSVHYNTLEVVKGAQVNGSMISLQAEALAAADAVDEVSPQQQ